MNPDRFATGLLNRIGPTTGPALTTSLPRTSLSRPERLPHSAQWKSASSSPTRTPRSASGESGSTGGFSRPYLFGRHGLGLGLGFGFGVTTSSSYVEYGAVAVPAVLRPWWQA